MPDRLSAHEVRRRETTGAKFRYHLLNSTLDALRLLRAGRWTVYDLAADLRIGWRTAYRILNSIEGAGIRLERQQEGHNVYYRVSRKTLAEVFRL